MTIMNQLHVVLDKAKVGTSTTPATLARQVPGSTEKEALAALAIDRSYTSRAIFTCQACGSTTATKTTWCVECNGNLQRSFEYVKGRRLLDKKPSPSF